MSVFVSNGLLSSTSLEQSEGTVAPTTLQFLSNGLLTSTSETSSEDEEPVLANQTRSDNVSSDADLASSSTSTFANNGLLSTPVPTSGVCGYYCPFLIPPKALVKHLTVVYCPQRLNGLYPKVF